MTHSPEHFLEKPTLLGAFLSVLLFWAIFWALVWAVELVWALFWALKRVHLLSRALFWVDLLSRVLFWALFRGLSVHQNLNGRVGEPDFSLTCCCPLSLYPTSLMQITTAGRGGKCLDCIQAFPASTLPFSLALVTILTFDWSCCQRFYHKRMYLSKQTLINLFKLNDIQSRPSSTR